MDEQKLFLNQKISSILEIAEKEGYDFFVFETKDDVFKLDKDNKGLFRHSLFLKCNSYFTYLSFDIIFKKSGNGQYIIQDFILNNELKEISFKIEMEENEKKKKFFDLFQYLFRNWIKDYFQINQKLTLALLGCETDPLDIKNLDYISFTGSPKLKYVNFTAKFNHLKDEPIQFLKGTVFNMGSGKIRCQFRYKYTSSNKNVELAFSSKEMLLKDFLNDISKSKTSRLGFVLNNQAALFEQFID